MGEKEFTHLTETGVHMVEVGAKPQQRRTAVASGKIHLQKETICVDNCPNSWNSSCQKDI